MKSKGPKNPVTAFYHFGRHMRKKLREESGGKVVPAGVALQIVSERWKKLTAAEKAKYEAMAKADKERYLKELKAYDPVKFKELQDQARERAGSKTSVNVRRKTDGPTKNLSAYYHFAREKRGEYKSQNMSHLDIQKQLSERWRSLADEDREKYKLMAIEDKTRYMRELKAYDPEAFAKFIEEEKQRVTTIKRRRRTTAGPIKNVTAYYHFAREKRSEYKAQNKSHLEVQKELSSRWKALGDEDKEKYELMAADDKKRYMEELKAYDPKAFAALMEEDAKIKEKKEPRPPKTTLELTIITRAR